MFVGLQIISPILKFREDNLFFKYKKLCTFKKKLCTYPKKKNMYLC